MEPKKKAKEKQSTREDERRQSANQSENVSECASVDVQTALCGVNSSYQHKCRSAKITTKWKTCPRLKEFAKLFLKREINFQKFVQVCISADKQLVCVLRWQIAYTLGMFSFFGNTTTLNWLRETNVQENQRRHLSTLERKHADSFVCVCTNFVKFRRFEKKFLW